MDDQKGPDEFQVIQQCLQGDRNRFSVLVERYKSMVYAVAYRMLGDQDAANDMGQESFISAYERLKDFQFNSKFSTWLYQIVLNKCRDYLRSGKGRVSADEIADILPAGTATPEESASSNESRDLVQHALNRLPADYREAVVLKHLEELEYEEMSRILGVGVGALKVRTHRGRELLRKILEESGVTHG